MSLSRWIASGGGIGFAPRAPGTFGALAGLALGAAALHFGQSALLLLILLVSAAGIWAIREVGGAEDAGWIVVDEVAGQMIAVLALPHDRPLGLILAFVLFRLFDIAKPGPIGMLDRRHDEWGVMGDDWLAGICAFLCIAVIFLIFPMSPA